MANMSYCRFQNTAQDLRNCHRAILDGEADDEELSDDERNAKANLIKTCREILEAVAAQEGGE